MPKLKQQSLHQQIIHELGIQIVEGRLEAGDKLPNAEELSDELGVSRTVTREALRVLEEKGLVSARPKVGIQVLPLTQWKMLDRDVLMWHYLSGPSAEFVRNLMEVRRIIEPAAAQLAAKNATPAEIDAIAAAYDELAASVNDLAAYKEADRTFHTAIFEASHNPLLAYLARTVNIDLDAGRNITGRIPRSLPESLPLHQQVVEAIRQRNADTAYRLSVELVNQIADFIEEALREDL